MAVDNKGGADLATNVGALPTNKAASAGAQGSAHEVLPAAVGEPAGSAARQHRAAEGRAALLPAAAGCVLRQGDAAAGDAERRQGPQDAEPLIASHDTDRSEEAPSARSGCGASSTRRRRWRSSGMFVAYPFGSILYHAFTRWDGITPAQWVGLHNFRLLWHDPIFLHALRNNAHLRALGADPGRAAADRRLRDPPARARLAVLPRDRLPARGLRDRRDRHPHRHRAPARRPAQPGARRGRARRPAARVARQLEHLDPADPARRRLDELRLQRAALPRRA